MPKRYHQSRRDRRHERMGEEKYLRHDENRSMDPRDRYARENPARRSEHERDHFNDEWRHEQDGERAVYRKFRALGNEFYAGMEPRRRQEMEDAGYLYEDHNAVANLPQNVIMRPYPHTGPYMPEGLEDSIRGVDWQMDYDDDKRREHFLPKKV